MFLRLTRKRSYWLHFLIAKTELAYFDKGSIVMTPYLSARATSTNKYFSTGPVFIDFVCKHLYRLLV